MSDFLQVLNQISAVAGQVATIANQISGRPTPIAPGTPLPISSPQPGPMAQDRVQLSSSAYSAPNVPVQAAAPGTTPASAGLMQVFSSLFSRISSFFKKLFAGSTTGATTETTRRVPMADAREQLFAMMPVGQTTLFGFVPVTVSRQADRVVISAGSFGSAAIIKKQGEFHFQENDKPSVRMSSVASTLTAAGDMRFDIALENGDKVTADILADGRTLRYKNQTLTLH